MAQRKDYYAILGVSEKASQDEVKRAYRKLARKHHPDVNPGDGDSEERFKEISEAYHVLGNEERRKQYDSVGPEAFAQDFDLSDFADHFRTVFTTGGGRRDVGFFEEIFGGGGLGGVRFGGFPGGDPAAGRGTRRPAPRKGADVQVELQLGLEEALSGTERTVRYRDRANATRSARVKIPPGVREGQRIRVRGKGEPSLSGGARGDLYLTVRIAAHPRFEIEGTNLRVEVPVTVYEAALGATVEVPTLSGSTRIKIPPGTRAGQVFRLRGKGATDSNGADLLARIRIVLPEAPDEATLQLLRDWRDQHPYDPRATTDD